MKQLKFMHITKTGGTAIEESAKACGVMWGQYDSTLVQKYTLNGIPKHGPITKLSNKRLYLKLKDQYDWFVVVRNPYERVVSAANYYKTYLDQYKSLDIMTCVKMYLESNVFGSLPATDYVYYNGQQIVKHILRFENLEYDFNNLMTKYNLNISLLKDINVSKKFMTVKDLTPNFIDLINTRYHDDFVNFGYQKIN